MKAYEKLGSFYLGRTYDADQDTVTAETTLYASKDLTTHAVCVGMTGSGKTGLCVGLLEEAAIDGIPAIVIDPKGDLSNLLLTFPKLRPADFRPWIDESEAARKGQTPDQYAASVAQQWKKGLADWDQSGERIASLKQAAEFAIYTPGSRSGRPLSVLRSFDAPDPALLEDEDALGERVLTAVAGLLALLGIDADPIRSRETILLSNLFRHAWQAGQHLDLASLIRQIQSPPIERVGVMELDVFYPAKERFELSMQLNNLLASPGFSAWMEGEPLKVPDLLWGPDGKPRIAVLSIAHLSESDRMFFVTLLLNEVLAWVRTQPGTSSLRALLYMDEVFGYFPPTANPPSKRPMLTLLKQARAYGLGIVLATQNPVDLDYKGLSNAGTWFLGRLQTERDKQRVLEGLEGVTAASGSRFDRASLDRQLSGLRSRVFLMNNVHDDHPTLFHTRWAMSYLRGPLTRTQIRTLIGADSKPGRAAEKRPAPARPAVPRAAAPPPAVTRATERPVLPTDVSQSFLAGAQVPGSDERLIYRPALLASSQLHFVNARSKVDLWREASFITPLSDAGNATIWNEARRVERRALALADEPFVGAAFDALPTRATKAKSYTSWGKALASHLYRNEAIELFKSAELKQTSEPGEEEGAFRARLGHLRRERRDLALAALEKRYAPKLARIQERMRKAEERVNREKSQYGQQKMQTAISVGATVLGALFGRKAVSLGSVGRATTAVRGVGRAARERDDVARAGRDLAAMGEQYAQLEREFETELDAVRDSFDAAELELTPVRIRPRKSDIEIGDVALIWTPWRIGAAGIASPAFDSA